MPDDVTLPDLSGTNKYNNKQPPDFADRFKTLFPRRPTLGCRPYFAHVKPSAARRVIDRSAKWSWRQIFKSPHGGLDGASATAAGGLAVDLCCRLGGLCCAAPGPGHLPVEATMGSAVSKEAQNGLDLAGGATSAWFGCARAPPTCSIVVLKWFAQVAMRISLPVGHETKLCSFHRAAGNQQILTRNLCLPSTLDYVRPESHIDENALQYTRTQRIDAPNCSNVRY